MPVAAPTRLGHILPTADSVRLFWTHSGGGGLTGFLVQRSADALAWTTIGTTGAAARVYLDQSNTVDDEAVWYYRISATDGVTPVYGDVRKVDRQPYYSPEYTLAQWVYDWLCTHYAFYQYRIEFPAARRLTDVKKDEWAEQFKDASFPYLGLQSWLDYNIPGGTSQAQSQGGRDYYWGYLHLTFVFEAVEKADAERQMARAMSEFQSIWECTWRFGGACGGRVPDEIYPSRPQLNTVFWDRFSWQTPLVNSPRAGNQAWLIRQDLTIQYHFLIQRFDCPLPKFEVYTLSGTDPVPNVAVHWVKPLDGGEYEIKKSATTTGDGYASWTLTPGELYDYEGAFKDYIGNDYLVIASVDPLADPSVVDESEQIGTIPAAVTIRFIEDSFIFIIQFTNVLITGSEPDTGEAAATASEPNLPTAANLFASEPNSPTAISAAASEPESETEISLFSSEP